MRWSHGIEKLRVCHMHQIQGFFSRESRYVAMKGRQSLFMGEKEKGNAKLGLGFRGRFVELKRAEVMRLG